MFYCTIVDDKKSSTELLAEYISKFTSLKVYKIYTDSLKALNEIPLDKPVDFLFMDIEMPGLSGVDLAKLVRNKTHYLIFTTAHNDHAVQSYEVKANGYLLKPIAFIVFAKLVNELLANLPLKKQGPLKIARTDPSLPYFEVRQIFESEVKQEKSKIIRIEKKDLVFIETMVNYVHIFTSVHENYIKAYRTLKVLAENFVDDFQILQVHRSYVVNMDKVLEHSRDKLWVKINGKKQAIPIGGTYLDAILARLNNNIEKGETGTE